MKKTIACLFSMCIILFSLTGCKIEFPDQVAEDFSSMESSSISQTGSDPSINEEISSSQESSSTEESSDMQQSESNSSSSSSAEQAGGEDVSKQPSSGEKDHYQTDPVPEGKPKPTEPQDTQANQQKVLYCTLSVDCMTILDNMSQFNQNKLSILPKNGIIYPQRKVIFYEGETVFDVLNREMKKNRIHMEYSMTPIYNSNYIEGIANLYEFDCGERSGWMYQVNGWYPNYGCSRYQLKDGDVIKWRYTCDLGRDIGGEWVDDR